MPQQSVNFLLQARTEPEMSVGSDHFYFIFLRLCHTFAAPTLTGWLLEQATNKLLSKTQWIRAIANHLH